MQRLTQVLMSPSGQVIAALIAEGQADPEVAQAFLTRWVSVRRRETRSVLEQGIGRSFPITQTFLADLERRTWVRRSAHCTDRC
jgi:Tetracyclin repressor-like, C-terminal domain